MKMLLKGLLGGILVPICIMGPVGLGFTYFGAWGGVFAIFSILGFGLYYEE